MRHNVLLSMILSLLFTSCAHGQQIEQEGSVVINTSLSHHFFEVFKDSASVSLSEMPSGRIPGFITKLIVKNDTLFVLDGYKSKAFFAYTSTGKPLFEYSKLGEAPDEYLFLGDVDVDDNYIYLLDNNSHKILILDKTGSFVKKHNVPARISHIKAFYDLKNKKSSYYFDMYSTEKARLLRHKSTRNDTMMLTPDGMANYNYCAENSFQSNKDEILYMPSYSSVIYELSEKDGVTNYMNLDFQGLMPDISFFSTLKGKRTEDKFKLMKDGFAYYYSFNANDTHILIGFVYEDKYYLCFINRFSQETSIYDLPSQFQILTLTNNQLYLRSNDSDNPIVVNISSLND